MNIYVAGKTQDIVNVNVVQGIVRSTGHKITYDWTEAIKRDGGDVNEVPVPKDRRYQYAMSDMGGVYASDLVIAIGHPDICGTLWECGMAVMSNHPLWLLWWDRCTRNSVFEDLPHVTFIHSTQELGECLWELSKKEGGLNPASMYRVEEFLDGNDLERVRDGDILGE